MRRSRNQTARDYRRALVTRHMDRSAAAEAYRVVRTGLLLSSDEPPGSILFTSPLSGEGKSVTCANIAVVLAKSNRSTVVLDADLRIPTQHKIFDVEPSTYALELQENPGMGSDPKALARWSRDIAPNLTIIPAGPPPSAPSELVESKAFYDLLATLTDKFDFVLIDSPPVGVVTDAAILASRVDGVLLVLDYKQANRRIAKRAISALEAVDANILGAVLNKYPIKHSEYGGAYTDQHYYSTENTEDTPLAVRDSRPH